MNLLWFHDLFMENMSRLAENMLRTMENIDMNGQRFLGDLALFRLLWIFLFLKRNFRKDVESIQVIYLGVMKTLLP